MSRIKEGFKVVRIANGEIFSARVNKFRESSLFTKMHTTYKMNAWTHPKKGFGPLAVFKTLSAALAFHSKLPITVLSNSPGSEVILHCFYRPSDKKVLSSPELPMWGDLPTGSDFASSVFLTNSTVGEE
jgi:hypothetical protein